jgi:Iron-containing redox enzyme
MSHNQLSEFVLDWTNDYESQATEIMMFQKETKLTEAQVQEFARVFFHLRGHFYKFLWTIGNLEGSRNEHKKVILGNIAEEFGGTGRSHDQMYQDFTASVGVDTSRELVREKYYLDFARAYNQEHIRKLCDDSFDQAWAIFAAYESLDNIDYNNLLEMLQRTELPLDLKFFRVHQQAWHYNNCEPELIKIWNKNPQSVQDGYQFVLQSQLKMLRDLNDHLFT